MEREPAPAESETHEAPPEDPNPYGAPPEDPNPYGAPPEDPLPEDPEPYGAPPDEAQLEDPEPYGPEPDEPEPYADPADLETQAYIPQRIAAAAAAETPSQGTPRVEVKAIAPGANPLAAPAQDRPQADTPTRSWRAKDTQSRARYTDEEERVWRARELFKLLGKCFRTLRLYPEGHRYRRQATTEFMAQLTRVLDVAGTVRVHVSEGKLLVDGEIVYEESNLRENLARRLFFDGVRSLTIGVGTTAAEGERLVLVLFYALTDAELDVTTLLDGVDLDHIDFEATSALAEAWEPPDYLSGESFELIESMNADVDRLVGKLTSNLVGEGIEFELSDGARETEEAARAENVEVEAEAAKLLYPIAPEALEAVHEEIARWSPQELLVAVSEASLAALRASDPSLSAADLGWILNQTLVAALRSKDLQFLAHILQRFEEERGKAPPALVPLLDEALAWLSTEAAVGQLLGIVLSGTYLGGTDVLLTLLERLGDLGPSVALELLVQGTSESLEERLLSFLEPAVAAKPEMLTQLLGPGVEARTSLATLSTLAKIETEADLTGLLDLAKEHPAKEVSSQAEHLWKTLTTAGRWQHYVRNLTNPSRLVRLQVLEKLLDVHEASAVPGLVEAIQSDEFLTRDHDERHAFLLTLRLLDPEGARPVLEEQTQRKAWLRNRAAAKDTRQLAGEVLQNLLDDDAVEPA